MKQSYHSHRVVLLSSRFQYPGQRLFFTRARLFLDRIELSGWSLGKKHQQDILLDEVDRIDWPRDPSKDASAVFHTRRGDEVRVQLPEASRWRRSLEERMHWSAPGRYPMARASHSTSRRDLPLQDLITYTTSMG